MEEITEKTEDTRGQWFVVHTLSGHENKVRDSILRQLQIGDEVPVYDAVIPTETVVEFRNGKKTEIKRKPFPGYLLVRMDLYNDLGVVDEKAWYLIRNVQGVLGFLGNANRPAPLSPEEIDGLMPKGGAGEEPAKPRIEFNVGEVVRIKDGPFEGCEGRIIEIDNERGKLNLEVSMFGRSTPVELEFWQVERIV
ncbi:MAG: transcription termination/antitermination protein NusG [Victivallaceae bacterium]|nr:transcription termination/antitermination protein NusG [Victivallaceae bacterium]